MTIRDRLRQRLTRLSLIVGACLLGITVGLVHWPPVVWLFALFIFPVIAWTIIVSGMRFARCPRCEDRMGVTARAAARERPTADNCPHCGVSLDEPMESPNNHA
jgi:hypothetical protein